MQIESIAQFSPDKTFRPKQYSSKPPPKILARLVNSFESVFFEMKYSLGIGKRNVACLTRRSGLTGTSFLGSSVHAAA